MKKYLKIIAPILVVVLVVGVFAACGKAEPTFEETLMEVSAHENFDFVMEINSTSKTKFEDQADDETSEPQNLKLKLSGKAQSDGATFVNVEMFDNEKNAYNTLTDLYLIGKDVYVNMYVLYGAIDSMSGAEGEVLKAFDTKNHYYKLNLDEMVADAEVEPSMEDPTILLELASDVAKITYNTVLKGAEGVEPPIINAIENGHQIKINNDNVVPLVKNIATILDSTIDTEIATLITKYREKGVSYQPIVETLETFRDNELEGFKENIVALKEFKMEDGNSVDCVATFTNTDNQSNVNIKFNAVSKDDYGDYIYDYDAEMNDNIDLGYDMEVEDGVEIASSDIDAEKDSSETSTTYITETSTEINFTITENKDVKIEVPTNILTEEEFEKYCGDFGMLMMSFMMMGLGQSAM